MIVQFSVWDYWGPMFLLIFVPFLLFVAVSAPLMRFLVKKTKRVAIALLPLVLLIPLGWAMFTYVVPAGARTECLYPRERAYTHTTAGTITAVRPADHIPLYFYEGTFRGGVLVTMDGVEYYSMAHPLLTVGSSLHFTYCPEEDLIMAFSPIGAEEVPGLQKPFVAPEPVPAEPIPRAQSILATVLIWAGFLGFALLLKITEWNLPRITLRQLSRDREHRFDVVPDPTVTVVTAVFCLPLILMALGAILSGSDWKLLGILVPGSVAAVCSPRFCAAHVRLEGRNIRIRRFFRERTIPLSNLRAIYWDRKQKGISPRRLFLVFDGWSLALDQISHLGLEDLHRRLSAVLHITH